MSEAWKQGWRRAVLWSAGGLLALIAALFAALETGALNGPVLWLAGDITGYQISCKALTGSLLSRFTCTGLTLGDDQGAFLTAERLSLNWDGSALFGNQVDIHALTLRDAKLTRVPQSKTASSSSVLPSTQIDIGRLDIAHFVVAVAERPAICAGLNGIAHIGPGGFKADLALARCGPNRGQMAFSGSYIKATGAIDVHAHGTDDGGLIAQLTGLKAGTTTVSADAAGTAASLNGHVVLSAEKVGAVNARFTAQDGTATSILASLEVAPDLKPSFLPAGAAMLTARLVKSGAGYAIPAANLHWGGLKADASLAISGNGALSGTAALDNAAPVVVSGARIGSLALHLAVAGNQSAPQVQGVATLKNVESSGSSIATLTASVQASLGKVLVATLDGSAKGAVLPAPASALFGPAFTFKAKIAHDRNGVSRIDATVNGRAAMLAANATFRKAAGSGRLTLNIADLGKAHAGFGGAAQVTVDLSTLALNGTASGTVTVTGKNIQAHGPGAALGRAPSLSAHVNAGNGQYSIDDLRLDTAAASASGSVRVDAKGALSASLKTSRGDLAGLSQLAGKPLSGAFSLSLRAGGTRASPVIAAVFAAPRAAVSNDIVQDLRVTLNARKSAAWTALVALSAKTPAGPVDLSADARTAPNGYSLAIRQGALGPASLSGKIARLGARYSGALTLSGQVLKPAGFFLGTPMSGTGRILLRAEGQSLTLQADLSHVTASPLKDATLRATARMTGMLGPLSLALSVKEGTNHLAAQARASLSPVSVTLTRLDGRWSQAPFALQDPATLTVKNGLTSLGVTRLDVAGGKLTLSAELGQGNLHAAADLVAMPVAPLAAMVHAPKASGTLTLSLQADLGARRTAAEFKLTASKMAFEGAGKKVKPADLAVTAAWDGAVLDADAKLSGLDNHDATLNARIPMVRKAGSYLPTLAPSGEVSADLSAQLEAARLMALLPVAEETASGLLSADVHVRGDVADPQFTGSVSLSNGSFTDLQTGTHLAKLDLKLAAAGGPHATLTLSGTDGNGGKLNANGSFSMEALETGGVGHLAGNLDIAFDNMELVREDLVRGAVSGKIAIVLPGNAPPTINGTLRTNTVRVDIGAAIPPSIPTIKVININGGPAAPPEAAAPQPSLFGTARINLALKIPNRLYVSGHGLTSEWSGDLKLGGTLNDPKYDGQLQIVTGQVELVGKMFDLQIGTVQISNALPGKAAVNIVAQNSGTDLTVTLTITGPVSDPKIAWSSTPSLPQSEILSHLFFGTGTPQLSAGQAFQLAQMSGALNSFGLGGGSSGGIVGFARNLTGLDVLSFTGPTGASTAGASVTAGKYINDRIYVGVTQGTSTSASSAEVRVKIAPHLTVTGTAGANNANSVGVDWRWSY